MSNYLKKYVIFLYLVYFGLKKMLHKKYIQNERTASEERFNLFRVIMPSDLFPCTFPSLFMP